MPVIRESEAWSVPEAALDRIRGISDRVEPDDPDLAPWLERYASQHGARLAADIAQIERFADPEARILEYGAVPLLMTGALAELGYEVSAVDLAPERFARSIEHLGLDVRRCDVEAEPVPFDEGSFDVVLFNELLEHLRIDPIFTLGEVRRVLRPGGLLLLSTPNLRSFRGLRNLALHDRGHASTGGIYEQYEKLRSLGHVGHVREYTLTEVVEFLGRLGLPVERVIHRGGHGAGLVGLAERIAPRFRPFFTVVARRATPGHTERERTA